MENYRSDNDSILVDEATKSEFYTFELPTRVTKLDPVFMFSFDLDEPFADAKTFNVELNPKLSKNSSKLDLIKKFQFNTDGIYRFNHEKFSSYFIEGEIKLLSLDSVLNKKSCFVSITYGNREEALHFIKGNFELTENKQ